MKNTKNIKAYEREKKRLSKKNLTPKEYETEIRKIAAKYNI